MRGHRDLRLAVRASLLCALLALILPFEVVRVLFAVPLALLLPGYAIVAATFARRSLPWQQLLLLSVALSLAVLALGGLLLDFVPGGVRSISWALLLLLVILNGCRVAALRRPRAPQGAPQWPRLRPPSRAEGALLGAGGLLAVTALVLAMTPLPAENALGFSELWISPHRNSQDVVARIGVGSNEKRRIAYFLRVRFGREKPMVRLFELDPGETRIVSVRKAPPPMTTLPVTAALFRQARPTKIYRRVVGWIPAPEAPR